MKNLNPLYEYYDAVTGMWIMDPIPGPLAPNSSGDFINKNFANKTIYGGTQSDPYNMQGKTLVKTDDSDSGIPWGKIYMGTMGTGLATKIGKDMLLTTKIMERYPEPKDLANSLKHMDSAYAHEVAAKLYQVKTRQEYKTVIKKYVLKSGGFFKYLMHTALGPFSTYHNIKDMNSDVVGVIGRHVRNK